MKKDIISAPYYSIKANETKEVTLEEITELKNLQEDWNNKTKEKDNHLITKVFLNSYTNEYLWVQILCFVMDDPTKGIMETKIAWNRKTKEWED